MHPITQRLPIHPAQAGSIRPRVALEHQGQGQHTSRSIRIGAAACLPTKRRCRVIQSCEFDRHAHLRAPVICHGGSESYEPESREERKSRRIQPLV
jgi:hypothetical protein